MWGPPEDLRPFATIPALLEAVEAHRVERAVAPVENSIEGAMTVVLDFLAGASETVVSGEAHVPVRLVLAIHPDAVPDRIEKVLSHPMAVSECRRRLRELGLDAVVSEAPSTAAAGTEAAKDPTRAAVLSRRGAELLGLRILADGIDDAPGNLTRFFLLGPELPPPSGDDLTSVVFTLPAHQPGVLYRALGPLADAGLNVTRIETRPVKGRIGFYRFFLDFEGHIDDAEVSAAVSKLEALTLTFRLLGSYPRWTGRTTS